jgi:hypothetical protein
MSLDQGHQGSGGRGRGHCWPSPDSYALAGVSHGSDPSDMTIGLSQLTDQNTPARAPEPEIVSASNNGAGGGGAGGGGEPGRGGGGGVGGNHMCCRLFELPPL